MAYYLTFFCRSGEENGSSALVRFLSKLTETGDSLLVKHAAADYVDEVDVCELATDNGSGAPEAGWVVLELSVGVEYNADSVIHASPNDEHGIWGSEPPGSTHPDREQHRLAACKAHLGSAHHPLVGYRLGRDVGVRGEPRCS